MRVDHREREDAGRDAAFRGDDGGSEGTGGVAWAERNPARGDGVDGGVLEAGVEHFGAGRIRVAISERARSESGAGTKDGPKGLSMDSGFAQARFAPEQLCATARHPGSARF